MVKNSRLGSLRELKAIVWLVEQGYEVFNNVNPDGPADIVAWNPVTNTALFIDVKTGHKKVNKDGSISIYHSLQSDKNRKPFVSYLAFIVETEEFIWI